MTIQLNNRQSLTVYHGSDVMVKKPELRQSTRALDFGGGFYTTTNRQQAVNFAKKVRARQKTNQSYVSVYTVDTVRLIADLKIKVFHRADEEWLDFVAAHRRNAYTGGNFDVVYGPVANDTIFKTFIAYENGVLTKAETLSRLKIRKLYNQLVFASAPALKYLTFSGTL
ncbi:hypothetical protein FACS1894107_03760 [Planctomycetales bacterium]|nr:hypothetical protein FACS1894107_03760 [Planctomycetales bacterium]GHT01604.1 hypothetical protein FACS1894108_15490 [Planctomycetales bacterium]